MSNWIRTNWGFITLGLFLVAIIFFLLSSILSNGRDEAIVTNTAFTDENWSQSIRLLKLANQEDYYLVLDNNGNFYLCYTSDKSRKLYLEKRDITGQLLWGPELLAVDEEIKIQKPIIYLLSNNELTPELLIAWKTIWSKSISDQLLHISFLEDSIVKKEPRFEQIQDAGQLEILEYSYNYSSNELLIAAAIQRDLAGKEDRDGVIILINQNGIDTLNYNLPKKAADLKGCKILAGEEVISLLFLYNQKEDPLYLIKLNKQGQVLRRVTKIDGFMLNTKKMEQFELSRVGDNYLLLWTTTLLNQQILNYLLFDSTGKAIVQEDNFINIGGYTAGFQLMENPDGYLDLYISHYTRKNNYKDTEIYNYRLSEDIQVLYPPLDITGSSMFEFNPTLLARGSDKYLFWQGYVTGGTEIYYSTTNQEITEVLKEESAKNFWRNPEIIFKQTMKVVTTVVFLFVVSLFPALAWLIYNIFNNGSIDKIMYWLNGLLLLFALRLYSERLLFTHYTGIMSRIARLELYIFVLIVTILLVYWILALKKGWKYRIEKTSRLVLGWYIIDGLLIGFLYGTPYFFTYLN